MKNGATNGFFLKDFTIIPTPESLLSAAGGERSPLTDAYAIGFGIMWAQRLARCAVDAINRL